MLRLRKPRPLLLKCGIMHFENICLTKGWRCVNVMIMKICVHVYEL